MSKDSCKRTDLLLVAGNPDEDILATRNIVAVYKHGIENKHKRCRPAAAANHTNP